jgi:spore cortex formation protein SpoVR/YcgB (stage V sporulation)
VKPSLVALVALTLAGCSVASSSSSTTAPVSQSEAMTTFCDHYNGPLLDAMNSEMEGAASDIEPVLAAFASARKDFVADSRSGDPEVETLADHVLAGIDEVVDQRRDARQPEQGDQRHRRRQHVRRGAEVDRRDA